MTNACDRSVKARCVSEISSLPQVLTLSGTNVEMPSRSVKHVPRVSTRFARLTRAPHGFDCGTTFAIDVPPRV